MSNNTPYGTTRIEYRKDGIGEPQYIEMTVEESGTPGLVIHPELGHGKWTGNWSLTHAPSGTRVPVGSRSDDIEEVRWLAEQLGETSVDWTADGETVRAEVLQNDAIKLLLQEAVL